MEITNYVDYIKEQLREFTDKDNLKWQQIGSSRLLLQNSKISLQFFTEYRVDNSLGITINNLKKKEYYDLFDIKERKGYAELTSFMTQNEIDTLNSITDPIKEIIYEYTVFIRKHCQDIMSGDFSTVGEGSPTYD
ncbi:MAG TPA: hypothetical protein PLW44_05595 [Chitinophagales bacterium]|nr:hypothetical protein [Chitinophagales bacterium]